MTSQVETDFEQINIKQNLSKLSISIYLIGIWSMLILVKNRQFSDMKSFFAFWLVPSDIQIFFVAANLD
jgi:hypothetical protein